MKQILILGRDIFCSYAFLKNYISKKTIEDWKSRKIGNRMYFSGIAYIEYSSIPAPSRAKLPTLEELTIKAQNEQKGSRGAHYRDKIQDYIWKHYADLHTYIGKHYPEVKDLDRASYARRWCAWKYFIEYMGGVPYGDSSIVRHIFHDMFGKKYTAEQLSRISKAMKRHGIEAKLFDGRHKGNNKGNIKYGEALWLRFSYYFLDDRKFPITQIREFLLNEFDRNDVPCVTMLRTKQKE
ncbi:MAG: hypothetical protein DI598_15265 [Pseudopedobacter saltans]|uniref:Uncharacterized protein n=1 Tax=Pseudopedobacter saltans TaxID=151895 RepID=A0A2W5EQI5_9SPHI|nr:MAG: hypothetical protein DI598_15265 [Pseudopedobacter saltans]